MSEFTIKQASRQSVKPLIAMYSESGCGKTYSSLLMARGIAGPTGVITMADSESGRGSLYADVLPGGYQTFDLSAPFTPARYIDALHAIYDSGAAVGIIDSGSHEWEGASGVLDMAAEIESKSGRPGLHCWRAPKMEHAKFIQELQRAPIPLIVCLRAKFKSRQGKNDQGKTCIIKDDHVSPIQAEDFIFEATAHMEILPNHHIHLSKWSHPSLKECFPKDGPITIGTGEAIARWCHNVGTPSAAQTGGRAATTSAAPDTKALKAKIWHLTQSIHNCPAGADKATQGVCMNKLQQALWDENLMSDTEALSEMSAERLTKLIDDLTKKLP